MTLGFDERRKGGHHIFYHDDIIEIINLQLLSEGKAKTLSDQAGKGYYYKI